MVKKLQFVVCTFIALGAIENLIAASPELAEEAQSRIIRMQAPVPPIEQFKGDENLIYKLMQHVMMQEGKKGLKRLVDTVPEAKKVLKQLTQEKHKELEGNGAIYYAGKRPLNQNEKLFINNKLDELGAKIFELGVVGTQSPWTPAAKAEVCCILADKVLGYLPSTKEITPDQALKIVLTAGFLKKYQTFGDYEIPTDEYHVSTKNVKQLPPYYQTILAANLMNILYADGSLGSIKIISELRYCTWDPFNSHDEWDKLTTTEQAQILCLYALTKDSIPNSALKRFLSGTYDHPVNTTKITEFKNTLPPHQQLLFLGTLICTIGHLAILNATRDTEHEKILKCTPYWRPEYSGIASGPKSYLLSRIESTIVQNIIRDLEKGGFKKEADQLRTLNEGTYTFLPEF